MPYKVVTDRTPALISASVSGNVISDKVLNPKKFPHKFTSCSFRHNGIEARGKFSNVTDNFIVVFFSTTAYARTRLWTGNKTVFCNFPCRSDSLKICNHITYTVLVKWLAGFVGSWKLYDRWRLCQLKDWSDYGLMKLCGFSKTGKV